jgi:outer membrane protein OmpA-like peptidoglycan-associated protein
MMIDKLTKALRRIISSVAFASFLVFSLTDCSHSEKMTVTPVQKPSIQEVRAILKAQIQEDNISVIHIGQTIRLILPSDYFFHPGSANLYQKQMEVISRIGQYIGTYHQSEVTVKGYTADNFGAKYLQVLSAKQAEVISYRLWMMGIKTQLVIASGLGVKNSVDTNKTVEGRFSNGRVEITFMYREDTPLYD